MSSRSLPPLAESLEAAKQHGNDPARCGYDLSRAIVLGVREARAHRPDLVVKYGSWLLKSHARKLSHEVWALHEQVYIALLQYGKYGSRRSAPGDEQAANDDMYLAQQHLNVLAAQFSNSLRVKRLEGMMWEAKGELDMAMADYDEILAADPANLLTLKRQVAVCRGRGRLGEAARKLVEYLSTFSSDQEAWLMLAEIYLTAQQYKRAAFCMEELILINPMSYLLHNRYGEILYTMGTSEKTGSHDQILTARKYFAHALELKPDCLRAMYGLLLCCSALGTSTKGKGTKVDTAELLAFVTPQILKMYTPAPGQPRSPMLSVVHAMIKNLS